MVRNTLVAMSQGGIYDHAGGGFHRYSVDEQWQVPHFEKMLYTQALMSLAYTRLYQIEPDEHYRDIVIGTLDFVLAEMQHPQGAFLLGTGCEQRTSRISRACMLKVRIISGAQKSSSLC